MNAMKTMLFFVLLIAPGTMMKKQPVKREGCPPSWVNHGRSCYFVVDTPTPKWSDARTFCQVLGGDLVKITSADENQFIFNLVAGQSTVTWNGAWIGLQRGAGSAFYWVDGTPLAGQYSAWNRGEPNNSNGEENCANIYAKSDNGGKWNDLSCDRGNPGNDDPVVVCEKAM